LDGRVVRNSPFCFSNVSRFCCSQAGDMMSSSAVL
jgi:hypothetical protein